MNFTNGMKTSEFMVAGAAPWGAMITNWIQTGQMDWRMFLATALMNFGYAISRGMAKSNQKTKK